MAGPYTCNSSNPILVFLSTIGLTAAHSLSFDQSDNSTYIFRIGVHTSSIHTLWNVVIYCTRVWEQYWYYTSVSRLIIVEFPPHVVVNVSCIKLAYLCHSPVIWLNILSIFWGYARHNKISLKRKAKLRWLTETFLCFLQFFAAVYNFCGFLITSQDDKSLS